MLILDVETAPSLGYVWQKWETDVIDFAAQWYILCFSVLWEGKIQTFALPDFSGYKKDKENDYKLVEKLWWFLNEADIVVGHNSDSFDLKKCNSRFIFHRMTPPKPYKTFDTLKAARKVMKENSNKLDDLGNALGLGRKLPHTGFHLWQGCMKGDMKAWRLMKKYNAQDVRLTEKLYKLIRPWTTHPNVNIATREMGACPKCGSKSLHARGMGYTKTSEYRRFQCQDCGSWSNSKQELLAKRITIV